MVSPVSEIRDRLAEIQNALAPYPGARLLGVTKGQAPETIAQAIQAGVTLLGNNYVQEGAQLREKIGAEKVEWHFIGHIQSRKAKLLTTYDCVQSVDRLEIAEALEKHSPKPIEVLLQVNIGEEPQKSGVLPADLAKLVEAVRGFSRVKVVGLMALPPLTLEPEGRRPYFRKMRQLFDETKAVLPLRVLSMGMSDDFRIALDEGSNLIRLGTILFGSRL